MTTEQLTAASDTATLTSPDTAPVEIAASPIETTPAPLTETATASAPEPTATVDPLGDLEEEAVRSSPRIKALLEAHARDVTAGVEGKHKQELEATQKAADERAQSEQYQRRLAEVNEVQQGSIVNTLASVIDEVAYGDPEARQRLQANLPKLREMAETLNRTTATRLDREAVDTTNAYLTSQFPDYRIKPEQVSAYDAALARGDFKARRELEFQIVGDAAIEAEVGKRVDSRMREVRAEAEKQLENQRTRDAEATATTRGGPTTINGRPAATKQYQSRQEIAADHAAGRLDNATARALYARVTNEF